MAQSHTIDRQALVALVKGNPGLRTVQIAEHFDRDIDDIEEALDWTVAQQFLERQTVLNGDGRKATAYFPFGTDPRTFLLPDAAATLNPTPTPAPAPPPKPAPAAKPAVADTYTPRSGSKAECALAALAERPHTLSELAAKMKCGSGSVNTYLHRPLELGTVAGVYNSAGKKHLHLTANPLPAGFGKLAPLDVPKFSEKRIDDKAQSAAQSNGQNGAASAPQNQPTASPSTIAAKHVANEPPAPAFLLAIPLEGGGLMIAEGDDSVTLSAGGTARLAPYLHWCRSLDEAGGPAPSREGKVLISEGDQQLTLSHERVVQLADYLLGRADAHA